MTSRFDYRVVASDDGACLVPRVALATTFWQRWRGLQWRRPLAADQGLMLRPARSIHTHWMRFAIDVTWLDRDLRVLAVRRALVPWRIAAGPADSQVVLETLAGALGDRWQVGLCVRLELFSAAR